MHKGDAMRNLPHDSEPGCWESSELARLARLESKSNAMADDVLVTWDARSRGEHPSLRLRRWTGYAWGVTLSLAALALIAASVISLARAPLGDAEDRRLDQFAAPRKLGPFSP
jgi:hypothetical protein